MAEKCPNCGGSGKTYERNRNGGCCYGYKGNCNMCNGSGKVDKTNQRDPKYTMHRVDNRNVPVEFYRPAEVEKKGGCFITTAVCNYHNMPDDCYELTILRKFRDEFILSKGLTHEINYYYKSSPIIVSKIDAMKAKDKENIYKILFEKITHCIFLIENDECEAAFDEYKKMVFSLEHFLP